MNLDSLSIALAQISYTVQTLSKKNFKAAVSEITTLISTHGFEAERHLYRTLITNIDFTLDSNNPKNRDSIHVQYLVQEVPSLISRPNFVTLLWKVTSSFFSTICKLLKLSPIQEILFALALEHSTNQDLASVSTEYIRQKLPELLRITLEFDNAATETGLNDLPVELLHSLLVHIKQLAEPSTQSSSTSSTTDVVATSKTIDPLIKPEHYEQLVTLLRKEYPKERLSLGHVILSPLLYPTSFNSTPNQLLSDSSSLSTAVWQMDASLADVVIEMGYSFTSSIEECRNALVQFGVQEIKPLNIARILGAMAKTHNGLIENTVIYNLNSQESNNSEKPTNQSQTWNVEIFVHAVNDLAPNMNWKDVLKEMDYNGFIIKDRQSLVLIVNAFKRALPDGIPIDLLYTRWHNAEGQLSWFAQAIRNPDIFCFGDYPAHPVNIDCLKHPPDDSKETWTWRSLNLLECLLRISESGLYQPTLELFKIALQRCAEVLLLGLLQLPNIWDSLKQELLQILIPSFLPNSPNSNAILNYIWNSQHHTTALRTTLLTSMADWYNRSSESDQQQRLSRVLEVVQDLKTLPTLLNAQPMPFIIDLACLASRRGYLKLDKWLSDKLRDHQEMFVQNTIQFLRKKVPQLSATNLKETNNGEITNGIPIFKPLINHDTIMIILTVLHATTSSVSADLAQEIHTMLNNASLITAEQHRLAQSTNNPTPAPLQTGTSSSALTQQTQPSSGMMPAISRMNNGTPTGIKDQENQPSSMYQNVTNPLFNPSSQTNYPPISLSPSNIFNSNPTHPTNQLSEPTNQRQMSLPLAQQQQQQQMFPAQSFMQSPTGSNIFPRTSMNISRSQGNLNALTNDPLLSQHMGNTGANNIAGVSASSHLSNSDIADVDVYFKRLYSKTNNPPPITVDDFLDIFTRCRESTIPREKDVFHNGVKNLFDEYKFYPQYPERELHLTAQLFGGLVERNLLPPQIITAAFRAINEGLKKPPSHNLFVFAVTALERCKLRLRENIQYCQLFKTAQSYRDLPSNLRDYIDYGALGEYPPNQLNNNQLISLQQQQTRTLTPTPQQSTLLSSSNQQSLSPLPNVQSTFPKINATQIPNQLPPYSTTRANTTTGVIPSVAQSANISSLLKAPSYEKVRVPPPPESIQDKVSFTFNNLSFANLSQKADELKESMQDDKYWQWVAQYLVMKRVSIEPNFHTLYAGFVSTLNVHILFDTVLGETHRNIKILLLGDKQMNNIPDRALLKNLGHWLGIITIGKNKPILAIDLDLKSLTIEAYHTGSQELLYVVPFIAKILESCTRSKIFQPPNPWLMGIMSVLAEMHQSPEFKLNMKFEIEVLCRQLQIQLNDLPIPHILQNKEYFEKLDKQLSRPAQLSTSHISLGMLHFSALQQQDQTVNSLISSVQGQQQHDQQQRQQGQSLALNDPAIIQQSPSYHPPSNALQSASTTTSSTSIPNAILTVPSSNVNGATASTNNATVPVPSQPQYKLSDFKSSIFQSLSTMLEINPNLLLFQHHPRLKTYIHSPIEQAINESLTTVQRSLKVATSAAETIARKDFMFNPDEQQLRTSARNMVAYLSSGLVLITARPALQEQIQTYIRNHLQTVLGVTQNSNETNTNSNAASSTTSGNSDLNAKTREMINQAANEIAQSNIELCCCLLQRITISRAIQHIDTRLLSDIEQRQRSRLEQKQWNVDPYNYNFQSEKLPEQIRLKYGPLNSHQLAIYEDFVHYIPGFKPSDNEKRESLQMEDNSPSLWDRLISDIEQVIQSQVNLTYNAPLQRLIDSLTILRTNLQTLPSAAQSALATVLNTIVYNLLEYYTQQAQSQDSEGATRFRDVHMAVLKLLIDIRLQITVITKQLTKCWLDCPNELKFNVHAVNTLIRNRLLDCRQVDAHISQLIDSGNNPALHFAVHFIRSCLIEQPACSDSDISSIIESLHRISLIGKQPAEAVRDLLEIIRLNYASSSVSSTDSSTSASSTTTTTTNSSSTTTTNANTATTPTANETNTTTPVNKIDRLVIISLSVINSGSKYLNNDEIETTTIAAKAKLILSEWVNITITQANRIAQQQAFQNVFNQMNIQGIFRSDDTIAKFLRMTIQLCVNSVYDIIRSTPANQPPHYIRCHQGIESLCRFLSLLTTHTSDLSNFAARIHLINRILGILAALCQVDHDDQQSDQFHPIAYQRIILNLFQESTASENTNDHVMYYIYLAFTNVLHLLRPQRVTGFSFAWLEIVAHRAFMSKLLAPNSKYIRQTQNMYALLLVDALRLVAPFIRSGEHTQSFQVYFKGVLKTFMLLLHDFPEFLCEYYYHFCDALPLVAHQLRNIVLSAFPKQMRCPDPFLVNFKVDMLNDISYSPFIAYNYSNNIQPPKFKANLDSYLRTRAPVTFLSELRSCLQQGADPGSHYNIRMINALVLYVASQAITAIQQKGSQVLVGSITHSAPMDIFQNLAVDLDTEGRYIFLNAMANHLRFPNTHTHYFSYTLLYLFAEANSESLQEQIVRVLLERLVANRPHPWGLLITFLELVRNPHLKLWSREFMNISPDVKRLLHTLTRGFPQFQTTKTHNQCKLIKCNFYRLILKSHYRLCSTKSTSTIQWPSTNVRRTFVDYFVNEHQHTYIPSSSVIPPKDSGTYFVNSGMNQFKNLFLQKQRPEDYIYKRVVNYQKCIRVGGKHNDLDDVGKDTYHHTFFEMLGNWSFGGDYFKEDACHMALDLLTRVYGLKKERLFITYFQGNEQMNIPEDSETRDIWLKLGILKHNIRPFGMKENFWEMGETGPCGPCTEIHYDHLGLNDPSLVNRDDPNVVELWNLVFMQYERRTDKSLCPLPQYHVDTGCGLERLTAVLNGKISNYDTDLFQPLFDSIHSFCSSSFPSYDLCDQQHQFAYRLLADHVRMCTISMNDGLLPEKTHSAGKLRKMLERACRISYEIFHAKPGLLSYLVPIVVQILNDAYPELNKNMNRIVEILKDFELNYYMKYERAKPFLINYIENLKNQQT
ncbi:unnamed protein product, partial [Didymodactylos carnosus]